jgi:hypothetical protein
MFSYLTNFFNILREEIITYRCQVFSALFTELCLRSSNITKIQKLFLTFDSFKRRIISEKILIENENLYDCFPNLPLEMCDIIVEYRKFDIPLNFWINYGIASKQFFENLPQTLFQNHNDAKYCIDIFIKEYDITDIRKFIFQIADRKELYDQNNHYKFYSTANFPDCILDLGNIVYTNHNLCRPVIIPAYI